MKKDILKDLLAKPGRQYSVSDFDPSFIGELSKQDAKGCLLYTSPSPRDTR